MFNNTTVYNYDTHCLQSKRYYNHVLSHYLTFTLNLTTMVNFQQYSIYDNLNFASINFPHFHFDSYIIRTCPACEVYFSQIIRYTRACSLYSGLFRRLRLLSFNLLSKGFLQNYLVLSTSFCVLSYI